MTISGMIKVGQVIANTTYTGGPQREFNETNYPATWEHYKEVRARVQEKDNRTLKRYIAFCDAKMEASLFGRFAKQRGFTSLTYKFAESELAGRENRD